MVEKILGGGIFDPSPARAGGCDCSNGCKGQSGDFKQGYNDGKKEMEY